jgi:poly(3-hydroxybutyrate) depolymerase
VEPLTAAEHLEMMAAAKVPARNYQRSQARIDRAVRAGASWEKVAAAAGISVAQARQEYRHWVRRQHVRSENPNPYGLGMDDAEYVAALARAVEPDADREAGQ